MLKSFLCWLRGVLEMPVQIGAKAHPFSDPTGLLSDCHRRIEMFLRSLEAVAIVKDRPLTEESRVPFESALRYFREAAPNQTADEEESLFPRMRQKCDPNMEAALERRSLSNTTIFWPDLCTLRWKDLGQRYLAAESLESTNVEAFRKAIACLLYTSRCV